jgi:hypothetical protein
MTTHTQLNGDAVKVSAANLGRIMDDMSAFTALRETWPALGNFDLAQQLQAIVDDRRNGVTATADQLKISLEDISKALTKIATDVETTDGNTAGKLQALVAELRARVGEDLAGLESAG